MKIRDIVTLKNDLKIRLNAKGSAFENEKLLLRKGSKVRIDDIFQGDAKIQQMDSMFLWTWIPLGILKDNIETHDPII